MPANSQLPLFENARVYPDPMTATFTQHTVQGSWEHSQDCKTCLKPHSWRATSSLNFPGMTLISDTTPPPGCHGPLLIIPDAVLGAASMSMSLLQNSSPGPDCTVTELVNKMQDIRRGANLPAITAEGQRCWFEDERARVWEFRPTPLANPVTSRATCGSCDVGLHFMRSVPGSVALLTRTEGLTTAISQGDLRWAVFNPWEESNPPSTFVSRGLLQGFIANADKEYVASAQQTADAGQCPREATKSLMRSRMTQGTATAVAKLGPPPPYASYE
ncbi:uncharacterized protein MKK02DRAFT_44498 [Dioszegia hungarica]|uniref:Uncharacterized protein n=1 Tax=Dioszegia hungarica TaxID=4972 RepID=A0AA38LSG3_9TREE|nr:uncharacterized protein MKK02DRAFT_44498 [Dioszegia hungarica]KAI9635802.1 hypothetical protein MKK02DRAFT_44498 [Dioszegia hungarica]